MHAALPPIAATYLSTPLPPSLYTIDLVYTLILTISTHRPNEVYHVTVMPCYDKKLEASRPDFYDDVHATRDVDCVITTGELERMMRERGWDISCPVPAAPKNEQMSDEPEPEIPSLLTHTGTSSGSYLHSLLASYTASDPSLQLTSRTVRSTDYEEYTLADATTGRAVFRGARCYGFRNLQNLVRRVGREAGVQVGRGAAGRLAGGGAKGRGAARALRARKMNLKAKDGEGVAGEGTHTEVAEERGYDYVEVMACPGGCVNGGGQLRPPPTLTLAAPEPIVQTRIADADTDAGLDAMVQNSARWGDKAWVKRVEAAYWHDLPTPPASPPQLPSAPLPESTSTLKPTTVDAQLPLPQTPSAISSMEKANSLALRVLSELCCPQSLSHSHSESHPDSDSESKHVLKTWDAPLDARAEALRRRFFRTEYHAVESEVLGIQVKW